MTESSSRAWLRVGVVGRAHGLDGSFYVASPMAELLSLGREVRVGTRLARIERRSGIAARPILRLDGVADRSAADALRGTELWVDRAQAPPLEEDEWWAEELEGCTVVCGELTVGVVERLMGLPSCEVLVVRRPDGAPELLVPLVGDAVSTVDVAARRIEVDLEFLGEA